MTTSKGLYFSQYALASRIIILAVLLASAACKNHQPKEHHAQNASPIPAGDAPLVVLASRSMTLAPEPYFVLYPNGKVIFGTPGPPAPAYRTALLPSDQVSDIYSRVSPAILDAWDNEVFTPGGSSTPSYYLFVRRHDGTFVSLASYSLTPSSSSPAKWPADTQPPAAVKDALEFLSKYDSEIASPWTPTEIEVVFESAVPGPEQKTWWPRRWPQPTTRQTIPIIRLDSAHAEQLNAHLRADGIVRIGRNAFDVNPRYPFQYEEVVVSPMTVLARKSGSPF